MKQKSPSKPNWGLSFGTLKLSLLLAVFWMPVYGQQELPNQTPPSPTSMLFQKYGDYPVSQYTGIPDIKIPIYTIKEGDITVPIYLSFHAAGLNLDDQPGIIGTGWTLHTGGLITRTINGLPDEHEGVTIPDFSSNYENRYFEMYDAYRNYLSDHELDLYSYNFLGRSGKYIPSAFYVLDPNATEFSPFKLKEDNLIFSTPTSILDENGISYNFGGENYEEYQEFQPSNFPLPLSAIATWHLGSIISTRYPGMGVGYQYQQGPMYITRPPAKFIMDDYFFQDYAPGNTVFYEDLFPYSVPNNDRIEWAPFARNYYTRVPQRISFSEGYLLFHLNSSKYLERIEIFNKDNQLLRTISLDSDNFPSSSYRRLKSVIFKDALGAEQERYSCAYYAEGAGVGTSNGKDYWGFYNGQPYLGDYTLRIPNFTFEYMSNGSHGYGTRFFSDFQNRDPSVEYTKTYMLQRITYPTGGYTVFDYEGNSTGMPKAVGGLRIKNISSYDRGGELASSKSYTYHSATSPELSVEKELFLEHSVVALTTLGEGRRRTISESAPVSLFPKGAPVGYYEVIETEGETTTRYSFDDGEAYVYEALNSQSNSIPGDGSVPSFRIFGNHYKPWNFGDLWAKEISGPGFKRTEIYDYESFIKNTVHDVVMNQTGFVVYTGTLNQYNEPYWHQYYGSLYNFANRYHYSGVKRLSKKVIWEKGSDNKEITTTENYQYNNTSYPMQVTSKTDTNSRGEVIKTQFTHANDYISNPVYADMALRNRIAEPVEQVETNITLNNTEIKRTKLDYDFFNPTSPDPGTVQLKAIKESVGGGTLETEAVVERYDSRGHILQQRGKDGVPISFIFGYGQLQPVAKIIGADYDSAIALVSQSYLDNYLSVTEDDIRTHLSALRAGLVGAQVITYTYKPGVGMSSETNARGQTVYYEYDNFQRLVTVKDHEGKILKSYNYQLKH
ncbi:hypothetical protein [Pedobacter heparinus]|uniref:hypothetical protein n=1 Tax=Pedobacter heparinus TaxID=984 RepID=UPI00292F6475|nr:hypothetical protein [Pedobacter heparinus]